MEYAHTSRRLRQLIPLTKVHKGDFLVFLPGQGEIKKGIRQILQKAHFQSDIIVTPLRTAFAGEQNRGDPTRFRPVKRKIVLSTDIAETSRWTDRGSKVVVDSGFCQVL